MTDNLELLERVRSGDAKSESLLVQNNMGLVRSVALRFIYSGVDYEDLCQIGCIGLVKAIRNFDTARGVMFSTYAVPVVIGEIRKFLRDDGPIKVSRSIREQYAIIRRAGQDFEKEAERSPTLSEMEQLTGFSSEEIVTALDAGSAVMSLDDRIGDDGDAALGDMIPFSEDVDDVELLALKEGIRHLSAEDRKLIVLRYFNSKTQQEVAQMLGMTQVQVSRREKKIIEKLRADLS